MASDGKIADKLVLIQDLVGEVRVTNEIFVATGSGLLDVIAQKSGADKRAVLLAYLRDCADSPFLGPDKKALAHRLFDEYSALPPSAIDKLFDPASMRHPANRRAIQAIGFISFGAATGFAVMSFLDYLKDADPPEPSIDAVSSSGTAPRADSASDDRDPLWYVGYAEGLRSLGLPSEAATCLDAACTPDASPTLYLLRGALHDASGDRESASEDYEHTIDLQQDRANPTLLMPFLSDMAGELGAIEQNFNPAPDVVDLLSDGAAVDLSTLPPLETPDGNHTDASAAGSDSFDGNGDGDAGGD